MSQTLTEFIESIPLDRQWLAEVEARGVCPHCGDALAVTREERAEGSNRRCMTLVSSTWCATIGRHITRPGKYG